MSKGNDGLSCVWSLCAGLMLTTSSVALAEPDVITLVAPEYWCPFSCAEGSEEEGFAVDITRAALATQGIRVRYVNMAYDRALQQVRHGTVDAVVPVMVDEAPDFVYPQQPVSATEYCFYSAPQSVWQYDGEASLAGVRLLATSGYRYGEPVDTYIELNKNGAVTLMQGGNIPDRMIRMVQSGRFDALLDDSRLFDYAIARNRYPVTLRNAGCLPEVYYGFAAFSPALSRTPHSVEAFNRGLKQIRASGELARILKRYAISDWQ
ncbi:substrate-binding periplasmic protein [Thalassolituus sp. LLYu03]|uniref:substrate-binding periplasmic protein n=1 Tax=Thalassolituus sp. LLYu03 TaxID=3421656 RepID=UPI003D28A58D